MRGDVPLVPYAAPIHWGVFPACAGMFRWRRGYDLGGWCFPRVRGDVPHLGDTSMEALQFSPRARGCSVDAAVDGWGGHVFPACAGMFLEVKQNLKVAHSFPRVRGDVPHLGDTSMEALQFSPRARGCSLGDFIGRPRKRVFPACAGMFLLSIGPSGAYCGFPRVRGDVPRPEGLVKVSIQFSPRARGCSGFLETLRRILWVFPACAGMFPGAAGSSPG